MGLETSRYVQCVVIDLKSNSPLPNFFDIIRLTIFKVPSWSYFSDFLYMLNKLDLLSRIHFREGSFGILRIYYTHPITIPISSLIQYAI